MNSYLQNHLQKVFRLLQKCSKQVLMENYMIHQGGVTFTNPMDLIQELAHNQQWHRLNLLQQYQSLQQRVWLL